MFNSPQEMCSSSRFKPTIAGVAIYTMISLWLKICFQQPGERHQNFFSFWELHLLLCNLEHQSGPSKVLISNPDSIMLPELLHLVYLWIALWITQHYLGWKLTKLTTLPQIVFVLLTICVQTIVSPVDKGVNTHLNLNHYNMLRISYKMNPLPQHTQISSLTLANIKTLLC